MYGSVLAGQFNWFVLKGEIDGKGKALMSVALQAIKVKLKASRYYNWWWIFRKHWNESVFSASMVTLHSMDL